MALSHTKQYKKTKTQRPTNYLRRKQQKYLYINIESGQYILKKNINNIFVFNARFIPSIQKISDISSKFNINNTYLT